MQIRTELRNSNTVEMGQKFRWRGKWYMLAERAGRRMAVFLEPNNPGGKPGKSGHAPPLDLNVDVLVTQ